MLENPYAPPTAESSVPNAPPDYGWEANDGALLVEREARLPMIDPFTGTDEETMTLHPVKLSFTPLWRYPVGIAAALAFGLCFFSPNDAGGILLALIAGGLFTVLFLNSIFSPRIKLEIFLSPATSARMHRAKWAANIIGIAALIFFVLPNLTGNHGLFGYAPFPVLLILIILQRLIARPLGNFTCRRKTGDGRFEIRRLHRAALERLRILQQSRSA